MARSLYQDRPIFPEKFLSYGLQYNASPLRYRRPRNPSFLVHLIMDIVWRNLAPYQPWYCTQPDHHVDGTYPVRHPLRAPICDTVYCSESQADASYRVRGDEPVLIRHECLES